MRLQHSLQRFIVHSLVAGMLAGSLMSAAPVPAAAAVESTSVSLIEDDFKSAPAGADAASFGYQYTAPASGTGLAATAAVPGGTGSAMRVAVQGGSGGSFAELTKTFASQQGTVTFETSFMSTTGTQPYINLIGRDALNAADLFAARISTSRGKIAFFSTKNGPADSSVAFTPGTWYDLKVEANVQTQKVSVWVNGTLIFSRIGIADSVRSIHKIQLTTSSNNGDLYFRDLLVKGDPVTYTPPTPTGLYYIPRNQEIAIFWDAGVTHASQHNIKIKEKPEDPWTVFVYNKTNFLPTERTSIKKVNGTDIVNGKTYIIGVSSVLKDLDGKMYEGPTTEMEATPNNVITVPVPAAGILNSLLVNDAYYGAKWTVQSGLNVGDLPFSEREYKVTEAPARFERMDWIQPSGNSQKYAEKPQLSVLTLRDAADLYVALDARTTLPAWLTPEAGWTPTGEVIRLADAAYPYAMNVYRRAAALNESVPLGLNPVDEVNAGRSIGYFVLAERKPVGLQTAQIPLWSNRSSLTVSGTVYESGVTMSVYNQQLPVSSLTLTGTSFETQVPLTLGANVVELRAGRMGSKLYDQVTATVYYDPTAPELTLEALPTATKEVAVELKGSVNEASTLTVKRNGTAVGDSVSAAVYEPFTLPIRLEEGDNVLTVTAADAAGNETTRELRIHYTFWVGTPEFRKLDGTPLTQWTPGAAFTAEKQITNTTSSARQITLFVVLLDDKLRMVDFSSAAVQFLPGETKILRTGFVLPDKRKGYQLKAYIRDGQDGMKPLSGEAVLP